MVIQTTHPTLTFAISLKYFIQMHTQCVKVQLPQDSTASFLWDDAKHMQSPSLSSQRIPVLKS